MPPATTGAGPFIEPPLAFTLLTVGNSRFVSNDQRIAPSFVEYARTAPSFDGENTTPGMTVIAENCALLHARLGMPHTGGCGGASHARAPSVNPTACRPPGSGAYSSTTGKYARSASAAMPH